VSDSVFETTFHFQGNKILKKMSILKCLTLVSYSNNISIVLIQIPMYLLWIFLEIDYEICICCQYCIHLLSSAELFTEQSVILHELGERI